MALLFVVLTICIPAIFAYSSVYGKETGKRYLFGSIVVTVFLTNAIIILAWFLFPCKITRYELLLINALASIFLAYFCLPLYRKECVSPTLVIKIGCFFVIALVIYSNLTYGQTALHADSATASMLTNAQLRSKDFFPDTWYYVNGDIWVFTAHIFTAPFLVLMKNQSLARMLGSALLCLVTVVAICFHYKKAFRSEAWTILIPLMFLFIIGERDMVMYESAYLPQMLLMSIFPVLCYKVYKNTSNKFILFGFCLLSILQIMGGIRYVAEGVLPLWCTCIVVLYFEIRDNDSIAWKPLFSKFLHFSLAILLPAILGLLIHIWLKRTHNVVYTANNALVFNNSINTCIDNISVYIANYFSCFGFSGDAYLISLDGILNIVSVMMCILIVFVIPVLQAIKLKDESEYVQFFFAYALIHNLIMFIMIVFFVAKTTSAHYVITSIFANMIISARYIYVYWIKQKHFEKYIWTALFLFASAISCFDMVLNSVGWEEKVLNQKAMQQQLVDRGLTKGYGDFWPVYGQEVYSDFNIRYGGLLINDGIPSKFLWLVDGTIFEPEDKETFLILTEQYNQEVSPNIPSLFEEPIDYFILNGHHVYVFDYDIAADIP